MQIVQKALSFLIKCYQWTFGLVFPPSCRFYPSCSEYAKEALQLYPPHYAIWLIMKRLLKCQPLCKGGLDPLPQPSKTRK